MSHPTPASIRPRPVAAPAEPTVELPPLRDAAQAILHRMTWEDCSCGKRRTTGRVDAETRVLLLRIANGEENAKPTRYHPCHLEDGVIHWTSAPPRPKTTHDCPCGRRSYGDQATSNKVADHRNRKPRNPRLTTIAYGCPDGGWHTAVYPVGEKLRQCPCGFIGYRNVEAAELMLAHYAEHSPFGATSGVIIYECERSVLHVGPTDRVRVARLRLVDTDAPTLFLPDSYGPLLARVGFDLSAVPGARAEALAAAYRAAARAAFDRAAELDALAVETTTHEDSRPFHMTLLRHADVLEAYPDAVVELTR